MCGILAVVGREFRTEQLLESLSLMNHRGPDFMHGLDFDGVFLGHNRLAILDLEERSNQPFEDGDYCMVFNGEIYNYLELRQRFDIPVKTTSDTEVLLKLYIRFGEKCLDLLNGMFAFVIYNKKTGDIFAARDRLGIKPLYFYEKGQTIIFSSEIAPILNLVPTQVDEFGLRQYRKLRMTVHGHTLYEQIKFFQPGTYFRNGRFNKYWSLDMSEQAPPDDDELFELINDAVQLRKRADVPVGSYLSGGLDSTILTYLLKPADTWTVGFEELNEFNWSDIADEGLNSRHHKIHVDGEQFLKEAQGMISKRMEPLSVPNEVLIYLMTKEVRKRNTVVLSGEGADELFMGYDRIFRWAKEQQDLQVQSFDEKYCYGTNADDEVIDFALSGINGKTVLDKVAYYFQIHHLQGLLRRLDNSTMLCSVEARVPFVDHRLIERLAGVSFDYKMGASFKEPLKRIFGHMIPRPIVERPKIGFPVPLDIVFNDNQIYSGDTPMDKWLLFNAMSFAKSTKNDCRN